MKLLPILILLCLVSCSGKKNAQAPNPILLSGKKTGSPSEVDAIKSPAQLNEESQIVGGDGRVYFAHLQILSETVRGAGCQDQQKLVEESLQDFLGGLSRDGELELKTTNRPQSVLNVELRSIGFDESRYQSSFINGKTSAPIPYEIEFFVRPNNVIQMRYLGKTSELRLDNTPVYSFIAKEKRGMCEITHNVNLFAENSGRFSVN